MGISLQEHFHRFDMHPYNMISNLGALSIRYSIVSLNFALSILVTDPFLQPKPFSFLLSYPNNKLFLHSRPASHPRNNSSAALNHHLHPVAQLISLLNALPQIGVDHDSSISSVSVSSATSVSSSSSSPLRLWATSFSSSRPGTPVHSR